MVPFNYIVNDPEVSVLHSYYVDVRIDTDGIAFFIRTSSSFTVIGKEGIKTVSQNTMHSQYLAGNGLRLGCLLCD